MAHKLDRKVAIVTGAGAGIGRTTARLLASEGASVVVADIQPDTGQETVRMIEAEGGRALFIEVDVSNTAQGNAMVQTTLKTFAGLDILHANAGLPGPSKLLIDWDDEEWEQIIAVNLSGVFKCCRAAIPAMAGRPCASIVITSSIAGLKPVVGIGGYNASKAAIISVAQTLAVECASMGIRVNVITPGIIMTAMGEATVEEFGESFDVKTMIPMQRLGQPEDVAQTVLYLVSEAASYMTGAVLTVDGGTILKLF